MIEIAGLPNGNLLQNADGGPAGEGAWLTVEETGEYSDGILSAGEYTDVHFILCIKGFTSLTFFVDLFGGEG